MLLELPDLIKHSTGKHIVLGMPFQLRILSIIDWVAQSSHRLDKIDGIISIYLFFTIITEINRIIRMWVIINLKKGCQTIYLPFVSLNHVNYTIRYEYIRKTSSRFPDITFIVSRLSSFH